MTRQICKIVYFDEESVTDYVQIVAGGELQSTTELLKWRDGSVEQAGSLSGKAGISGVFRALTGWGASAEGTISESISFNSNKLVRNIIKNTILTDFLQILDAENTKETTSETNKGAIRRFEGYSISVEKDSLSYIVMVSPYLSMLRTGTSIPAGEFDIALDKFENTLKNAKGQSSRIILDLSKSKAPINKYIGGVMREMKRKKSIQKIIIFRQKEYCLLTRDML